MSSYQAYSRKAPQQAQNQTLVAWLKWLTMELEVTVLLILAAQLWKALKVSILCFSIWQGLLLYMIPDLIILSDDKSVGTESETDYSK
jgi:hypothetical protein